MLAVGHAGNASLHGGKDPDMDEGQLEKIRVGHGFIAALDQSGGSTPDALAAYGIAKDSYSTDEQMFALMQEMRSRIAQSPAFDGDRILGAILFEDSVRRDIGDLPFADCLWSRKRIVPFLKVDRGLAPLSNGVQLMKPISDLDELLSLGLKKRVFGTKMRSLIHFADAAGITAVAEQQFAVARKILDVGLVPILEPEVAIDSPEKYEAEALLKSAILELLSGLAKENLIMVKLTLPEVDDFYEKLVRHPNILRVLALSGGYQRAEANARLSRNHGVIASFSRALIDGLSRSQDDQEFNDTLARSIESIFEASIT
jgi:fructose-bisphosphate aldolase, class I